MAPFEDEVPASDEEHTAIRMDINLADYLEQAFDGVTRDLDAWEAQEEPPEEEEEEEEEEIEGNVPGTGGVNSRRRMGDEAEWEDEDEDRYSNYDASTQPTPSMSATPSASNPPSGYATPSSLPPHLAPAAVLEAKLVYFSQFREEQKGNGGRKRSRSVSRSRSDQGSQPYAQGEDKADGDGGKEGGDSVRHRKRKEASQDRKMRDRKQKKDEGAGIYYQLKPELRDRFNEVLRIVLDVTLGEDIKACKGAFQGLQQTSRKLGNADWSPTLEELKRRRVQILPWDGRTPVIVVDRDGRIIIVLVPPPSPGPAPPPPRPGSSRRRRQEESFTDCAHEAYHVVEKAAEKAKWAENQTLPKPSGEETQNRRGDYKSFNLGWSMGCGAKKPAPFKYGKHNTKILTEYRQNHRIRRLTRFASAVMAFYFPKMFPKYRHVITALAGHPEGPGSSPPFPDGVFAAHSANVGRAAYAYMHEDFLNLAFGICAIQALGKFDHTKGGHLYFSQLGFATQFPAGCTILLPSAAITHGNVPISVKDGEYRASLVHYTPAGLFRYVDYNFRTKTSIEDELKANVAAGTATKEDLAKWRRDERVRDVKRLEEALNLFSTTESLFADQKRVFGSK